MKKIRAIIIGAGSRGLTYSKKMYNEGGKFEVVAVAEPIDDRRNEVKEMWSLAEENCYTDYRPLLERGKIADIAVIATMDRDHFAPAMKAIALGYHLLLEKPIAPTEEECVALTKAAEAKGVHVIICTVLRYTPLFMKIKQLIKNGCIGRVLSVNHEECVGNTHQSHSFVRGNWGNSQKSSGMLLQKSCHDLDLLQWLLDKKCKKIQSFGTLSYFTKENAPKGATEYCTDGCPHEEKCPYSALKLYLHSDSSWFRNTATRILFPTDEQVKHAISTTQYGKCVFKCDNDVVDHQTVNMLFEDDITVTFCMNAFNKGGRFIHIMGTKGEIRASLSKDEPIFLFDFETRETDEIPFLGEDGIAAGHGGGDDGIIHTLYEYISGSYTGDSVPTIGQSLYNHMLVFAAEKSRETNTVVDVEKFIASYRQ